MTRGTPDWYEKRREIQPVVRADIGELAVRLGAPASVDRQGHIECLDGFENGLTAWESDTGVAGSSVGIVGNKAYTGGHCVRLQTAADAAAYARVLRDVWCPHTSRAGFECRFHIDADPTSIQWRIINHFTTHWHNLWIRFRPSDGQLAYLTTGNTWVEIDTGLDVLGGYSTYAYLKLIINLGNERYVRVNYNNEVYDLDGIVGYTEFATTVHRTVANFYVEGDAAQAGDVYLDNVIMTTDEP